MVWCVTDSGKAYQDTLEKTLETIHPKLRYSWIFSLGNVDRKFAYSLLAKGYASNFIEPIEKTCDELLKALEGLFLFLFGHRFVGVDTVDVVSVFSLSPFVKAETFDVPNEILNDSQKQQIFLENIDKYINNPSGMVISFIMGESLDFNFERFYYLMEEIQKKFKNSLISDKYGDLFFFTCALCSSYSNDNRISVFWTEV